MTEQHKLRDANKLNQILSTVAHTYGLECRKLHDWHDLKTIILPNNDFVTISQKQIVRRGIFVGRYEFVNSYSVTLDSSVIREKIKLHRLQTALNDIVESELRRIAIENQLSNRGT